MSPSPTEPATQPLAQPDPRRWYALGVLAAGLSMIVLDGTIVGVALPTIIADLHLHLTDAQWVNSLYNVVFAALLLTTGRIGDRWGRRGIFMAGVVIFLAGSILAALATGAGPLIWSRVVQGVGGAMILPSTLSTVNATFRGRDRAAAFGVWGAVMSGMAALGPLLGGWLTQSFDWRWIFWVNVPLGALILIGAVLFVPATRGAAGRPGLDVDGLLTSALGFGALVFALIEGTQLGWWRPREDFSVFGLVWPRTAAISPIPVIGAIGLVFIALFVLWERHRARNGRDALLDLALFRTPTFTWGNLTAMMVAMGEFALVLVLPLYLINVAELSVLGTGGVLATMALGAFFSGASARHLAARLGAARTVVVGLALEVIGVAAVTVTIGVRASWWLIAAVLVIYGAGLGLASAQLTSTVLADIPAEQSGQGSATQSTVRQLGSAIGSAAAGTALAIGLTVALPGRLAGLVPAAQADTLTRAVIDSAGGAITGMRARGSSPLTDALEQGFAYAAMGATAVAGVFLLLGLIGSLRVAAAARRSHAAV